MECYGLGSVLESAAAAPDAAPGAEHWYSKLGVYQGLFVLSCCPLAFIPPFPQIGMPLASALGYNN